MILFKLDNEWQSVKRMLKKKYPTLTEKDLVFNFGQEEFLIEQLASKLKLPQEEIRATLLKLKAEAPMEETQEGNEAIG